MMKLDSGNEIVVPDCSELDGLIGNIFARMLVKKYNRSSNHIDKKRSI